MSAKLGKKSARKVGTHLETWGWSGTDELRGGECEEEGVLQWGIYAFPRRSRKLCPIILSSRTLQGENYQENDILAM